MSNYNRRSYDREARTTARGDPDADCDKRRGRLCKAALYAGLDDRAPPTDARAMAAALEVCASAAEKQRAHAEHEAKSVTEAILKKAGFKPVKS